MFKTTIVNRFKNKFFSRISITFLICGMAFISDAQIILGYEYSKGLDVENFTDHKEQGIGVGVANRIKKIGGILYFDFSIRSGSIKHDLSDIESNDYGITTLALGLEYAILSKRFQPYVGIDGGWTEVVLKENKEVNFSYLNYAPSAGLRFYLNRNLAIDASYKKVFISPVDKEGIDLSLLSTLNVGFKVGFASN